MLINILVLHPRAFALGNGAAHLAIPHQDKLQFGIPAPTLGELVGEFAVPAAVQAEHSRGASCGPESPPEQRPSHLDNP